MSDSIRGAKGAGYEYWGRRSHWSKASVPGKDSKNYTHKREREEGKRESNERDDEND